MGILAGDQGENLTGKGDHDTTCDGEHTILAEQYRLRELCEDGGQFRNYFVFNRVQGILIPEAVWDRFISGLPAEELEYNEVYDTYFCCAVVAAWA